MARHRAFGREAADATHWVRTVDVPNAELVAATASRCDEVWQVTDDAPAAPQEAASRSLSAMLRSSASVISGSGRRGRTEASMEVEW